MNADGVGWTEGNRLVADLGSERHLAARILRERTSREWSQSELARQMAAVGCPIPQTAISRIEPNEAGESTRDITVDEAIGFARVFAIPFAELLMPADEFESLEQVRMLEAAGRARRDYEERINELAIYAARDAGFRSRLREYAKGKPAAIPAFAFATPRSMAVRPIVEDVEARLELMASRANNRAPRRPR